MSFSAMRPHHRHVVGAYTIAVFGVIGLLWSILLTIVKFRSEFTCEDTLISICRGSCSLAFRDAWSKIADLPVTIAAAAFFACTLLLASAILLAPHRFARSCRSLGMALGWVGLITAMAFAFRAKVILGGWCELCGILYLACGGVFVGAWIGLGRWVGPLRAFARPWRVDRTAVVAVVVVLWAFVAGIAIQLKLYRQAIARVREASLLSCGEFKQRELPVPALVVSAPGEARVVVALFLDLSCPVCRDEFQRWRQRQAAEPDIELRLYHFPATRKARENDAVIASRALECMIEANLSDATKTIDRLFALQGGPEPYFRRDKLVEVARDVGLAEEALDRCLQSRPVQDRVNRHRSYANHVRLPGAPGVMIAAIADDGLDGLKKLPSGLHEARLDDELHAVRELSSSPRHVP